MTAMTTRVPLSLVMVAAAAAAIGGQTATQPKPAGTSAQTPTAQTQPRPTPAPTAPAQARPAAPAAPTGRTVPAPAPAPVIRRAPAAPVSVRGGMAITVTDPAGTTMPGIHVTVVGATDRGADTNASGQLNLPGLLAGNYRLRFSSDQVITYEREVVVTAGRVLNLDVALFPAPKPVAPPPPPPPAPVAPPPKAATGPAGQPQTLSLVDLAERQLISGKDPRRDTLVACSGNTRSMLVQLNQPQAQRAYADAEALYYVIAGQGTVTVGEGKPQQVEAGGYVALPRGAAHTLARRGNRPLIMLAVLSGEACEEAK